MASKPINKDYLIASLKNFDEKVLSQKYNQGGGDSESGDLNVIESISVNGEIISPDENKNVDIIMPDITGLASTEYVDEALKDIDVDLTGYAKTTDIPTVTNDLTDELKTGYDEAVANSHIHENKTVIDKLTESDDGKLLFDGEEIQGISSGNITISEEIGNIIEIKEDGIYVPPVKISEDEKNAIITDENGALYVEDKSEEIEQIQTELSPKVKYHKYLNTELDYCYARLSVDALTNNITLSSGIVLPFIKSEGNMNSNNDAFTIYLTSNKTYEITSDVRITDGDAILQIYDITNNKILTAFNKGATYAKNNAGNSICGSVIYTPENDCEICIRTAYIYTAEGNPYLPAETASTKYSYLSIKEINRQITIDPVEHINEANGIEDTPVGTIIPIMSNTAPLHYLICDGTEYNIADYPYLAQHFVDEFGSVNYFGGDGTNTFAVPDLRGEFLRGTGANGHANQGSGADVGVHQNATLHPGIYTYQRTATISEIGHGADAEGEGHMVEYADIKNTGSYATFIQTTKNFESNFYPSSYTSRPTNTSVLYCIKAFPTYFMKNIYNGNEETVLYEGSTKVEWGTTNSEINKEIVLIDSVKNYDNLMVYYALYSSSKDTLILDTKILNPSDIIDNSSEFYLSSVWNELASSLRCVLTDVNTLMIKNSVITNPSNVNTSALGVNVYKIVGYKTAYIE